MAFVGAAGLWCLVVSYTFSAVPALRAVQPYRFLIPAVTCLSVPAFTALWESWRVVCDAPPAVRRVVACGVFACAPGLTGYLLDLSRPPLACGLTPGERHVLDAVRDLPPGGRVLCEPETVGHLVPLWCGKPVLGGLNDQAFLKHRFAGATEPGLLFGRPAPAWGEQDLRHYLETYAVGYAVFTSAATRAVADGFPGLFEAVEADGAFAVYRVVRPRTGWVLEGVGAVEVGRDRFTVSGLDGLLVTKFHYSSRLRLPAGVVAEPVRVLDDPVPFLGLRAATPTESCDIFFR